MELKDVLSALRRQWWLPVAGAVLGLCASLTYALLVTPVYSAQTQLFVSTTDSSTSSEAFQGGQFSQQRVASYAQLLSGKELAARVIDRLGLEEDPEELTARITATPLADTVLINVSVTDSSPERSQRIAEALGAEFTELVAELETPDGAANAPVKVTVTERPELPESPSAPEIPRTVGIGTVAGLLLGAGVAVLRRLLDRTVKDPETASEEGGAPVIGTVLRDRGLALRHVYDPRVPTRAAEDYRHLRTALQFLSADEPPQMIMVSSAMPSEGKTTLAINLALALAEGGLQVTLVDADLRRPRVTVYLGLVGAVGLTNVLSGSADRADVVQTYGDSGLQVIGAGPIPANPGEFLSSRQMFKLLDELRATNDFVLLDASPLLPVADATGLAVMVDGVLLSVRHGQSRKDQVRQAAATLDRMGARKSGMVLNVVPPKADFATAYGYGTTYAEETHPRG